MRRGRARTALRLAAFAPLPGAVLFLTGAAPGCPPDTLARSERIAGLDFSWCVGARGSQGPVRASYPGGARAVEGAYRDSRPVGPWSTWHENGKLAWRGEFGSMPSPAMGSGSPRPGLWPLRGPGDGLGPNESPMEGVWEFWWEDGTRRRVAHYRSGEYDGSVEDWRPDGSLYERAQRVHRSLDGPHEVWHRTGQRALVETWENGRLTGAWQRFYPDGKPRESGEYLAGKKNGLWTAWYPNGKKSSEGRFENGKQVGEWQTFHANGAPKLIEHYAAGTRDGEVRGWHFDGTEVRRDSYANGKRVSSREFDLEPDPSNLPEGWASLSSVFASGRRDLEGEDSSCPEGTRAVERTSVTGLKDTGCIDASDRKQGAWTGVFRKGSKRLEHNYLDGEPDGLQREWWDDGQLRLEASYERGVPHGPSTLWGGAGSPCVSGRFEHGVAVGIWRVCGGAFWIPELEIELDSSGRLVRWQRWETEEGDAGALIEAGDRTTADAYRVTRFDSRTGYPVLEIETPAEPYLENAVTPSGLRLPRPGVRVTQTGLAIERMSLGEVQAQGRYENGRRVGDWYFPQSGSQQSYPSVAPAARE